MCGICGFANFNHVRAPQQVLKKMTDAIAHRGPDGEGQYTDRWWPWVIGVCRFWIYLIWPASRWPVLMGIMYWFTMERYTISRDPYRIKKVWLYL